MLHKRHWLLLKFLAVIMCPKIPLMKGKKRQITLKRRKRMINCQKVRIQEIWIHVAALLDTTCVILEKPSFRVLVFSKMESVLSSLRHLKDKEHICNDKYTKAV